MSAEYDRILERLLGLSGCLRVKEVIFDAACEILNSY